MSGAAPPISPVTGGAIYEATAKAGKAYADAERSADVEYTELQKMTSKENQAELTKVALGEIAERHLTGFERGFRQSVYYSLL